MTSVPHITIALDSDTFAYVLYAQTQHGTAVAGPRLFRGEPWPTIAWQSPTQEAAEQEARKLQGYLDSVHAKKGPSKAKLRAQGE